MTPRLCDSSANLSPQGVRQECAESQFLGNSKNTELHSELELVKMYFLSRNAWQIADHLVTSVWGHQESILAHAFRPEMTTIYSLGQIVFPFPIILFLTTLWWDVSNTQKNGVTNIIKSSWCTCYRSSTQQGLHIRIGFYLCFCLIL